jgi:hypothetical protein
MNLTNFDILNNHTIKFELPIGHFLELMNVGMWLLHNHVTYNNMCILDTLKNQFGWWKLTISGVATFYSLNSFPTFSHVHIIYWKHCCISTPNIFNANLTFKNIYKINHWLFLEWVILLYSHLTTLVQYVKFFWWNWASYCIHTIKVEGSQDYIGMINSS